MLPIVNSDADDVLAANIDLINLTRSPVLARLRCSAYDCSKVSVANAGLRVLEFAGLAFPMSDPDLLSLTADYQHRYRAALFLQTLALTFAAIQGHELQTEQQPGVAA